MPTGSPVIISPQSSIILDTGQHYFVRNNTNGRLTLPDGRTDFLRWARVAYRVEAGEETIVPWAVIALYFGDPRSKDKIFKAEDSQGESVVPTRQAELLRLSVFYGVYEQGVDSISEMVPDVTIKTLQGVEVIPPVFDPDGVYVYGAQRSMNKSTDIATMMGELQEQMEQLQARYDTIQLNGDNNGAIPVDNPMGVPR